MAGSTSKKKTQSKSTSKSRSNGSRGGKTSSSRSATAAKATPRSVEEIKQRNQVKAVLLFAAAVLVLFLVIVRGENVWQWFHDLLMGLFGGWAIMWPLLMAYIAIVTALERPRGKLSTKIWMTAIVIVLICTAVYVFSNITYAETMNLFDKLKYLYTLGVEKGGAGLVGGLIGMPIIAAFGASPAKIFTVILLSAAIMILTGTTLSQLYLAFKKPVTAVSTGIQNRRIRKAEEQRLLEESYNDTEHIQMPMHPVLTPMSGDLADAFKIEKTKKKDKKKSEKLKELNRVFGIEEQEEPYNASPVVTVETTTPEIPETSEVQTEEPADNLFPIISPEPIAEEPTQEEPANEAIAEEVPVAPEILLQTEETKSEATQVPSAATLTPVDSSSDALENATKAAEEFMKKKEEAEKQEMASTAQMALYNSNKDKENTYVFPPLHLLSAGKKLDAAAETEELQSNGKKLVDTLKSFGVQTKIVDICRGPSVTRYELQPAAGVKISKITNLADDLALNLAANGVRIEAPIPGKAAVGIEIPNKNKSVVRMRELVESNAFATSKSKLTVALGRDIAGQVTVADLAKMPHMLIAGTTGSGKSVCINSLIVSLMYKSSPDDVRFLMIDPKVVELGVYNGIPHLLVPVVTDPRKAAGALNWAVTEMLNRYKMFAEFNVKDLQGYNNLAKLNNYQDENGQPMPKMPQIVIIIDELADLMMAAPKEVEDSICRLAQMARAAGMHLVVATQRPTVDVVTGLIKANIPSRIAFAVSSAIDSRTILDSIGAEKLLGQGDMLFSPVGVQKPTRIQGCFVSESEIESIVDFVKKARSIDYDEKIIEDIERNSIAEKGKGDKEAASDSDMDPMMDEAIKVVVEAGQASTSLLQRRLRLGYARAGRLIDEMESLGIVGPHEGSKSRKVLMTHAQWLERNMQKADSEPQQLSLEDNEN